MLSQKGVVFRYTIAVALVLLALMNVPAARAASGVTFVPGTVTIDAALQGSLTATVQDAAADTNGATFFAVTAAQSADAGAWAFVSIAGFTQLVDGDWSLEDAVWVGLALAVRHADGIWSSALKGRSGFATLLALVPDSELDAEARAGLLPRLQPLALDATTYRFPWQPGTSMYYGYLGVHAGGYAGLGKYKAVDFLSDGNTALGHAPNKLLAAADGVIDYVCNDLANNLNTAIRIGSMMYLHLLPPNSNLVVGHSFKQGETIGQLRTGNFSDRCGYGYQGDNWFHVHWSFPDTSSTTGTFLAGGWTLTLADQTWRRGNTTVVTQTWMLADFPYKTFIPFSNN